jgi:hypothetical protein
MEMSPRHWENKGKKPARMALHLTSIYPGDRTNPEFLVAAAWGKI